MSTTQDPQQLANQGATLWYKLTGKENIRQVENLTQQLTDLWWAIQGVADGDESQEAIQILEDSIKENTPA